MRVLAITILLSVMLAAAACGDRTAESSPEISDGILPACWKITSTYLASDSDVKGMSAKLGTDLVAVRNVKIDAAGIPLQVNTVETTSPPGAKSVRDLFLKSGQPAAKFVLSGNRLFEFMCDNGLVAAKMKHILGLLDERTRTWRVEMEVAPFDRIHDAMKWNLLFNAASAQHRNPGDNNASREITELAADFKFGDTLYLRMETPDWGAPVYTFAPEPLERSRAHDLLSVRFGDLPVVADVPRVTIEATVATRSFAGYRPDGSIDRSANLCETLSWPVLSPEVRQILYECFDGKRSDRENVESILCWVYHNIAYKGDVTGSRYGTVQVLRQRYGHCWDKTDVFVTLCRRARIPARLVHGWWVGRSGHVWAQVYLEDEGWVSVDPTCSWLGVTNDYVPLFISEDGNSRFVFTDIPKITALD